MRKDFETMWVLRKNENTYQLIKAQRFNPEFHKKLFWKNFFKESKERISNTKININNPWVVGIGLLVLSTLFAVVLGI